MNVNHKIVGKGIVHDGFCTLCGRYHNIMYQNCTYHGGWYMVRACLKIMLGAKVPALTLAGGFHYL